MAETFGKEWGEVIERKDCPRCDSPAVVRARPTRNSFEEHIVCNKCHLVKFVGIASVEYMSDQKKLNRFKLLKAKARTKREESRLDSRIAVVEERMKLSGLLRLDRHSGSTSRNQEEKGI